VAIFVPSPAGFPGPSYIEKTRASRVFFQVTGELRGFTVTNLLTFKKLPHAREVRFQRLEPIFLERIKHNLLRRFGVIVSLGSQHPRRSLAFLHPSRPRRRSYSLCFHSRRGLLFRISNRSLPCIILFFTIYTLTFNTNKATSKVVPIYFSIIVIIYSAIALLRFYTSSSTCLTYSDVN
jgi:hypothetical protein